MGEVAAAPTARRIESLDFIRGCALFGILLMNIVGMGLGPAYDNPTILGGDKGINLQTWYFFNVGFEGTQRALFSILFGAGIILFSSRAEASARSDHADLYFRRQLLLIGFGLFNAWILLWIGDILFYYGVTALFLFAFRKLPARTLLIIGLTAFALGALWSAAEANGKVRQYEAARAAQSVPAAKRSDKQKEAIEKWEESRLAGPPPPAVAAMKRNMTSGYLSAQAELAPIIRHFQSWNIYRFFADFFGMMMIGMALFKFGILTLEARTRTYLAMAVGGYAAGLPMNIYEANLIMANSFSSLGYAKGLITYDFSRLVLTMGHLGLLMLFLKSGILGWFRRAMAAVGRMALTNYLTHSVIALIIFVLLGFWGALERHQLYYIVFSIWIAQLIASPAWLKYFHFGPVEWLWRYLTYLKAPPFRKNRNNAPMVVVPAAAE
ncbi:MAG TPA: DUF418 domain-containing protein [Sphingomicrobium sp.]|nr:DUF418 domain-containing protein [Sphingomicrobium sp.]